MNPLTKALDGIGASVLLFFQTLRYLPTLPRQWRRLLDQCLFMGYATLPLVAILSFFIGGVLALQFAYATVDIGLKEFIGTIVGLSMVLELAPVMTAVMVSGRIGSAVTAELASMKVYQEVDALRTMNISPERFLVMPRVVALMLVMPVLTIFSMVTGWVGGQIVSQMVDWIDLAPKAYYQSLTSAMTLGDIGKGLIKGQAFALGIILISCVTGLRASGGPREIGAAVTKAVVVCIIYILVSDYFITHALF